VIDLHTHSTVSDGSDSPAEVAELAAKAGLKAFALTDHDRLDGLTEARARAGELGVELVPGCELSCEHAATMHVLVYDIEPGEGPLQDELVALQHARDTRNDRMAVILADLGLPVTREEMEEEAGGIGAGRPHIAAILVRKGVVASVQEAFDVWLAKGRPAYVEKDRLAPADALHLARASGGRPVLAHPLSLKLEPVALESTVRELKDLGLVGIEAVYGRYSPEERAGLLALAQSVGVITTGGSDHHGTYKPDLTVGTGRGDLAVPDDFLDRLRST
jgi:3',5'-nucleoside bisphosphate phosphatase